MGVVAVHAVVATVGPAAEGVGSVVGEQTGVDILQRGR